MHTHEGQNAQCGRDYSYSSSRGWGSTAQSACREHNNSEQTFYRWKKKYGDTELADGKRLRVLEKETAELKKMLAESMLENRVLKEPNSKKW